MTPSDPNLEQQNWLLKMAWFTLLLAGGLAFFRLVVVRVWVKKQGSAPCPHALGWMTDNPSRPRSFEEEQA